MNRILSKPMHLADQVIRYANNATSYREKCRQIMSTTQNLAAKLQEMIDQADIECYEPPILRMSESLVKALENAVSLVRKCSAKGLIKYLLVLHAADFGRSLTQLESCIHDVDWILSVCYSNSHERLGIATYPPFIRKERIRALVWDIIASISIGPSDEKGAIAGTIILMAKESPSTGKLIVEEGGVECLLKLVKGGNMECQENSARAIGYLGRDQESVEYIIRADVCSVFAEIFEQGPKKVQAAVAWAVSKLVASYPKCQDTFLEHNIVGSLVKLLDEREAEVSQEAVLALSKFCCAENCLCLENSKTLIAAGGEKLLVKIVYSGEQEVRAAALLLLCYIALNVPHCQELAEAKVPAALEWASKQPFIIQDKTFESLLPEARSMF